MKPYSTSVQRDRSADDARTMKTNHRRGSKDSPQRYKGGALFQRTSALSDTAVSARADFDFSNGNRGMAKSVRGAKKYVNTRFRFHENAATRRLASMDDPAGED